MDTIGARVRAAILSNGSLQKDVASAVGMTTDALSRALNGQRGFSASELAAIARLLDADLHYLSTGEADPHTLTVSARHAFDPDTRRRSADGAEADRTVINGVVLALRQADLHTSPPELPRTPDEMANLLGQDFARDFINRLDALGINVIRIEDISTAYSFMADGRPVIVIRSTGNWFYENWSLAHELGHLCLGHSGIVPGSAVVDAAEAAANEFAAELLLPATALIDVDESVVESAMAELIWAYGVSTEAMRNRLENLDRPVSGSVQALLLKNTQRALRHHWIWGADDPITERMTEASARRFPQSWIEGHLARIAQGTLHKDTLAWMLGVASEALEVEEPPSTGPTDTADLADLLG